jgi:hypothetical protein
MHACNPVVYCNATANALTVGGAENQDLTFRLSYSIHLHEELSLYATKAVAFTFTATSTERIDLVNKDNGASAFGFAGHFEKLPDQSLGFTLPLANQVCRGYGKECRVGFGGHGLGQVGLSCSGRAVKKNALEWCPLSGKELGESGGENDRL